MLVGGNDPILMREMVVIFAASHHNEATATTYPPRTFDFVDRTSSGNKSMSLPSVSSSSSSRSLDEHFNPFSVELDDANIAMSSTSGNSASAPSHFNPFRDDIDLLTSTFPTTS